METGKFTPPEENKLRVCAAMKSPVGTLSDRTVCEADGGALPRQVRYYCTGAGNRTFVLLHAQGTSSESYFDVAKQLGKTAKVILLDCYGHGGSSHNAELYQLDKIGDDFQKQRNSKNWGLPSMRLQNQAFGRFSVQPPRKQKEKHRTSNEVQCFFGGE